MCAAIAWRSIAALYGLGAHAPPVVTSERVAAAAHPADRQRLRHELEQVVATGATREFRYRVLDEGEPVRHHEVNVSAAPGGGGPGRRVVGIVWDVTAEVQRVQLRLEKEAAEGASAAKTAFLSRVSHELRTPLNAVLGFSQLLLSDATALLEAGQRERAQHIHRAGTHLLALVDDLLDLGTIEAGAERVALPAVDLDAVLEESLRWVEPQVRAAGIAIELRPTGARVRGDGRRLQQVISNLLSNAVKYNRPHGSVTLAPRPQPDPHWLVLSVRDTGRGMSGAQPARLFEPFNRLGAERDDIPGTGIGLHIARRLVERMGGRIEVSSVPGEGSEFHIRLAVAAGNATDAPAPAPRAAAASRCEGAPLELLYIEDNPVNALLVREVLAARSDVRVHVAVSAREGVAMALALLPGVILVDMELPDADGFEVLQRLRAESVLDGTPCIALSANAMPEYVARARAAGFDDYWTKPIELSTFAAAIDALEVAAPIRSAG